MPSAVVAKLTFMGIISSSLFCLPGAMLYDAKDKEYIEIVAIAVGSGTQLAVSSPESRVSRLMMFS